MKVHIIAFVALLLVFFSLEAFSDTEKASPSFQTGAGVDFYYFPFPDIYVELGTRNQSFPLNLRGRAGSSLIGLNFAIEVALTDIGVKNLDLFAAFGAGTIWASQWTGGQVGVRVPFGSTHFYSRLGIGNIRLYSLESREAREHPNHDRVVLFGIGYNFGG